MTASYNKNSLDKWLLMRQLMGDPRSTRATLRLAFWLLDHLNGRTGQCNPGRRTLIRETGMDLSSIKRAQRKLVGLGVFTITIGGDIYGKTNSYVPDWTWRAPQASNTPPARATADPCTGGADGPSPGSSLAPKTVKETVNNEPLGKPGKINQTGLKCATSVPPKPRDVDWNGWVRWLYEFHAIDVKDAWDFIMDTPDQLTQAGLSTANADAKLDTLLRLSRNHGKSQPLEFIRQEIRKFVARQNSASG